MNNIAANAKNRLRDLELRTAQIIGVHNQLATTYHSTKRIVGFLLWSGIAQWVAFGLALWLL